MARSATPRDMLHILRHHSVELQRQLAVSPVQLSMPTDGKGARIKVSVRPGQRQKVPRMIDFVMEDDVVKIRLEVSEDYQDYELYFDRSK